MFEFQPSVLFDLWLYKCFILASLSSRDLESRSCITQKNSFYHNLYIPIFFAFILMSLWLQLVVNLVIVMGSSWNLIVLLGLISTYSRTELELWYCLERYDGCCFMSERMAMIELNGDKRISLVQPRVEMSLAEMRISRWVNVIVLKDKKWVHM